MVNFFHRLHNIDIKKAVCYFGVSLSMWALVLNVNIYLNDKSQHINTHIDNNIDVNNNGTIAQNIGDKLDRVAQKDKDISNKIKNDVKINARSDLKGDAKDAVISDVKAKKDVKSLSVGLKKKQDILFKKSYKDKKLVVGNIAKTFVASAKSMNVPADVANSAHQALSHVVNFTKDIGVNSVYKILYSTTSVEKNVKSTKAVKNIKNGDKNNVKTLTTRNELLYVQLITNSGRKIEIYKYTDGNGNTNYYNKDGSGVIKKALFKAPIRAIVSSKFGLRTDPITGNVKMHRGVDYKASKGAPILAAADGVVTEMAYNHGGYGRFIKIRHNNTYSTLYAHMSNFGKYIYKGAKIKQNEVIGHVGTTGRATGSHLHYELHQNGIPINPIKASNNIMLAELAGKNKEKFYNYKNNVDKTIIEVAKNGTIEFAVNDYENSNLEFAMNEYAKSNYGGSNYGNSEFDDVNY